MTSTSLHDVACSQGGVAESEAISLLQNMVSIRSESCHEQEIADFLVGRMAALGLDSHIDPAGNAVATVGNGSKHVVLLGHMDTVPGGPPVEIRDGLLFGRGSVDAKGPLATFVMAASKLARQPDFDDLDLRLTVIGAVEEEVSSSKGARYIAEQLRPDVCVIGEPSSAQAVTLGYKGRLLMRVERRCPTSHSAGPEPTAGALVVRDWNRVEGLAATFNQDVDGIFARLQIELQSIQSERLADEELCRATFGFRLPPALEPRQLEESLRDLMPGAELEAFGHEVSWVEDRKQPWVNAFCAAIRGVAKTRPKLKYKTGTSDMNVVAPRWRCPILAYGPGDSSLDHTPREHLSLKEYVLAIDVLVEALSNWGRGQVGAVPRADHGKGG